jgi:hypothetical protein
MKLIVWSSLFWDVNVAYTGSYGRFGATYLFYLQGPSSANVPGPIGRPETSGNNYQSALRNIPEERILHLYRGGSPTSPF